MPLTVSVDEDRTSQPLALPWLRAWLLTGLIFTASVGSLEAFWRAEGYRPTVPESKDLWYFWRQRVCRDDGKVVVFLGTSRIMADISIETLGECLPDYRAVQLGLDGTQSSIGILNDLVADPVFNGTIVCELDTPLLVRSSWEEHLDYLEFRPSSLHQFWETVARSWLCGRLTVFRLGSCDLKALLVRFLSGGMMSRPTKLRMTFAREGQWDFTNVGGGEEFGRAAMQEYRQKYKQNVPPTWDTVSHDLPSINAIARRLKARGGRLVFLRAPSTGERWKLEEHYHSKKDNWDRFARLSEAICIHFQDNLEMRQLPCPDGSHLDARDASRFTRALVRELFASQHADPKSRVVDQQLMTHFARYGVRFVNSMQPSGGSSL